MGGARTRPLVTHRLEVATLGAVAAVMVAGATLPTAGGNVLRGATHSIFLSTYRPEVTLWTYGSVAGMGACLAAGLLLLRRPAIPFAPAALVLALASRVVLNFSRRGPAELAYPFTGPERHAEYIASVPLYTRDPTGFLRRFADLGPRLSEHTAGHPAGATMLFGAVDQLGFPGPWAEVVVILAAGAATAPLVWWLARTRLDAAEARTATLLWVFAPSVLVESATSADAIFACAGTLTALLLVRGRTAAGALAAALGTFLSYALAAVPVWACLVIAQASGRTRAVRAAAAAAVVAAVLYAGLWLATGYDPIAAARATADRYSTGAGHRRSYWFWLVGDPAAFGLGLGVPALLALVRSIRERFPPALALGTIVAAGALSGATKGEVERIWLFLTPFAAIAAAPVAARWRPPAVLGLLTVQALATEILFRTPW